MTKNEPPNKPPNKPPLKSDGARRPDARLASATRALARRPAQSTVLATPVVESDAWETFGRRVSPKTRKAYATDLEQFFAHVGCKPDDYAAVATLTPAHVVSYLNVHSRRDASGRVVNAATVARKLSAVRTLLRWYRACGVIDRNPAEVVTSPRVSRKSPRHGLTKEQARDIVEAAGSSPCPPGITEYQNRVRCLRDRAVALVMLRGGLRREEVSLLRLGDLHDVGGIRAMFVRGKGDKSRTLPVHDEVAKAVSRYLAAAKRDPDGPMDVPVFLPVVNRRTTRTDRPITPSQLFNVIVAAAKRAEIKKTISPHSLRHAAITFALDAGAQLERVQHFAGHADPGTTIRYFRTSDDLKKSPVNLIDF